MKLDKCISCGSNKIIPNLLISDKGAQGYGGLRIAIDKNPSAFILKQRKWLNLKGFLCCECGFVHTYCLDELDEMWKVYSTLNN